MSQHPCDSVLVTLFVHELITQHVVASDQADIPHILDETHAHNANIIETSYVGDGLRLALDDGTSFRIAIMKE